MRPTCGEKCGLSGIVQPLADGQHVAGAGMLISYTDLDVRTPAVRCPIRTLQPASSTRHAMPGCSSMGVRKRTNSRTRQAKPLTVPAREGRW